MINEGAAFSDRKESVLQLNRAIEELQKFDDVPQSLQQLRQNYGDVIASYINYL